jgi:hypothetical protein
VFGPIPHNQFHFSPLPNPSSSLNTRGQTLRSVSSSNQRARLPPILEKWLERPSGENSFSAAGGFRPHIKRIYYQFCITYPHYRGYEFLLGAAFFSHVTSFTSATLRSLGFVGLVQRVSLFNCKFSIPVSRTFVCHACTRPRCGGLSMGYVDTWVRK